MSRQKLKKIHGINDNISKKCHDKGLLRVHRCLNTKAQAFQNVTTV